MNRQDALCANLRRFRQHSQATMQRSGASAEGERGVILLGELEQVFRGERPPSGELLGPLSAFANLLQGGRLPADYAPLTFGDACEVLLEIVAAKGDARWRFDPGLSDSTARALGVDGMGAGLDRLERENRAGWQAHAAQNRHFVLAAMERAAGSDLAVVLGAARDYDLPLEEIAQRFRRVIVVDVCPEADVLAALGRSLGAPGVLDRLSVQRFDLTGSYNQFVADVRRIVTDAENQPSAERQLQALFCGYDVPLGAARLCAEEVVPDFVVSSMVLTQLGLAYRSFVTEAFQQRGFDPVGLERGAVGQALSLLSCLVEQQHIAALLRQRLAVLTSDVSQITATIGPDGKFALVGPARSQLSVPALSGRLPAGTKPLTTGGWGWLRLVPRGAGAPGAMMQVEAAVFERPNDRAR